MWDANQPGLPGWDPRLRQRRRRVALGIAAVVVFLIMLVIGGVGVLSFEFRGFLDFRNYHPAGQGKHSRHLSVKVTPRVGLTDGATVSVTTAALPRTIDLAAVTTCLAEADTRHVGSDACDANSAEYFVASSGRLTVSYRIHRVITVKSGTFDCASRPGRCLVVAASTVNYDDSGGMPISFAPHLPQVALQPTTSASRGLTLAGSVAPSPSPVGKPVIVTAAGFEPGEPVVIARCTAAYLHAGITACAQDANLALFMLFGPPDPRLFPTRWHADGSGRVAEAVTLPPSVVPLDLGPSSLPPAQCSTASTCVLAVVALVDQGRSAVIPFTVTG